MLQKIKRIIPQKIKKGYRRLRDLLLPVEVRDTLYWLRIQQPLTGLFGPYHQQNCKKIEIDLTFDCNIKCINCNKSCRQAPSREAISVEQIKKIIQESIEHERRWESVMLTGGEPTLSPFFFDIINLVLAYKKEFSPQTIIDVFTNGKGVDVSAALNKLPAEVCVRNSRKASFMNIFYPLNMAPVDLKEYKYVDYSNACVIAENCGIGLNCYGYYLCGIAAGIDRVLGFDIGRKKMPLPGDMFIEQRRRLCRYCGFFQRRYKYTKKERISPTWQEAYENYKRKNPQLSYY